MGTVVAFYYNPLFHRNHTSLYMPAEQGYIKGIINEFQEGNLTEILKYNLRNHNNKQSKQ